MAEVVACSLPPTQYRCKRDRRRTRYGYYQRRLFASIVLVRTASLLLLNRFVIQFPLTLYEHASRIQCALDDW